MTTGSPQTAARRAGSPPWWLRALVGLPLAGCWGVMAMFAASLTGWGTETSPVAQIRRDAGALTALAVCGAVAAALLTWTVVGNGHRAWVRYGAVLGLAPVALLLTAYVTDRF